MAYSAVAHEATSVLENVGAAETPKAYSALPADADEAPHPGKTSPVNPSRPAPPRPAPRPAGRPDPSTAGSARPRQTATTSAKLPLSVVSIIGFVLSGLGFLLITVPFGLWLGYRGRAEAAGGRREGLPFAKGAIYLGWAWVVFWVLALIAYIWILL